MVLSTSLDGFSAGVTYGFRGVRFPLWGRTIVAMTSVMAAGAAMTLGGAAGSLFPGRLAGLLGGGSLVLLGVWAVLRGLCAGGRTHAPARVLSWRIKSLGLAIQILREPMEADLDASGSIGGVEAAWLGLALSLDALGAGFCVNLGGALPLYLPLLVGLGNWLFLSGGILVGRLFRAERMPILSVLPGIVLVALGVMRLV